MRTPSQTRGIDHRPAGARAQVRERCGRARSTEAIVQRLFEDTIDDLGRTLSRAVAGP